MYLGLADILCTDFVRMDRIAAFDFDGTLTRKDTLIEFLRFAGGRARFYAVFARYSPLLILMRLGLYDHQKAKEKIFAHYFRGMPTERFDELCKQFFEQKGTSLVYQQAKEQIRKHRAQGDEVVIISASIENWVRHFADALGADRLLATQVETEQDKLTGRFLTANCYGKEKVQRLHAAYPDKDRYYLIAYGDSRGDKELLQLANESYYKLFRQ